MNDRANTRAPGEPLLAIDSSTSIGSVAVGDAQGVRAEIVLNVGAGHSAALLPAVDEAMRIARLRPADLGGIVVGGGPGSFTGLRIAAATAKGMLQALDVPLFAFSGLLATAAAHWAAPADVWGLIDARRRDVFVARYSFADGVRVLDPPMACTLDELISRVRSGGGGRVIFAGDAAVRHAAELERETGGRIAPAHLAIPRASSLLWLAQAAPELGRVGDPAAWEPEYIRAAGVERIAAARAAGGGAA